jgi:hypothetical protein
MTSCCGQVSVEQRQHHATEIDSIFDMSGRQYVIVRDRLILEVLSVTDGVEDRPRQRNAELAGDFAIDIRQMPTDYGSSLPRPRQTPWQLFRLPVR